MAWAKKWQLEFNTNKCKVLHFGHNNGSRNYMMNSYVLESSKVEKNLSVMISNDLKCTSHIDYVVLKANRLLGMLHPSIQSKVKAITLPLYIISCQTSFRTLRSSLESILSKRYRQARKGTKACG